MDINRDRQNWFGSLIRRTSLNLNNIFDQKMSVFGITSSNYWILKLLWEGDGLTQKQLVEALGVKPASLTGMIDSMVDKGWVRRSPDPKDARVNRIFLTTAGQELELLANDIIIECEETVCEGLTEEEKEIFRLVLKKVLRNLENAQKSKQSTI